VGAPRASRLRQHILPGHDSEPACPSVAPKRQQPPENVMSRYLAPLGFTLAATWVGALFILLSK